MLFVILALIFQSLSLIFGKKAALSISSYTFNNIITCKFYYISMICLFFQALVWQLALQKIALNKAYFFMSGIYFVIMFSSYFIFKESISTFNIIGVLIIFIGIVNLLRVEN